MKWVGIERQWKQRSGEMERDFGKIMNDKPAAVPGRHEQLVENLQEKYGIAKKGRFADMLFENIIARSIESLPDNFRSIVLLSDVEKLRYTEIAKTLACPVGTVCSRLYRGRKILQQRLSNYNTDNVPSVKKLEDSKYLQKVGYK
ncbi:MAG: hypothetical protein JXA06_06930 [Bacteroidetes bacterium]|nr:hypothetical protein [Bacteroidota bacterium]